MPAGERRERYVYVERPARGRGYRLTKAQINREQPSPVSAGNVKTEPHAKLATPPKKHGPRKILENFIAALLSSAA